jgi:anti-sigma B factor antagonist
MEGLTITTRAAGRCLIVTLRGELDVTNAAMAEQAVSEASVDSYAHLLFDLSELAFMDSTGIRVLIRARRRAGEQDATVALTGLTRSVSRIVDITGLDRAFAIYGSLEEALAARHAEHAAAPEPAD